MKTYDAHHIRNVALLGHGGAGKTTLAEAMLFESNEISRRGTVEEHTTVSDYHEIEHERNSSVFGTVMFAEWRDYKINIIDTPGYVDYVGEVIGALRVVDTGIMVLSSPNGVEVGTETIWKYTKQFQTPVICVVNKVDHEHSDFWRTVEQAKDRFGREVTVVQYPLNEGTGFNTIIDVLKMTAYVFPASGGTPTKTDIPDSEKARAAQLHNELIEIIAENDENLMDHYLDKGELTEEEMRTGLTHSLIKREIVPVFCTSAKNNMGAGRLMTFIDVVIPAPVEMPPVKTLSGVELPADPKGKTCAFVFKSTSEQNVGEMSFFRVYSGIVKHGMDVVNEQTGVTERLGQLFVVNGHKRHDVESLEAGDIGAVVKLKNTHVNNTLHEKGMNLVLPPIEFPHPRVRTSVVSNRKGEEDKLGVALHHLHEEDPTLIIEHSVELNQVIMHAQGEMHLQTAKHRLVNRYKLDVEFQPARVPYRETIRKSVDGSYRHKKQTGGAGQFAEVHMRVEPYFEGMSDPSGLTVRGTEITNLPWGGKLVFLNCIVGGVIEARFLPAIMKGVMEKMTEGPVTGSYVRDVRVSVYDGKMHAVDSNEAAFKTAGRMAFKEAFINADPQLLEPMYTVTVLMPEDQVGDVMSDLPLRRAEIIGVDADGHYQILTCRMPLVELDRYATVLRSLTAGRANFDAEFAEYVPVANQIASKLHQEYLAHAKDED
ncbi:MAG: elongation factor G [Ignavibacteria bacterium]|nr:elongation factor G [Ignavibacteria bacterium]MBP6510427.1 elongation factor G [Candidatus Kapabacteria bacterium]MBK6417851.1 elongation factor G [Ignavibacteria bacterium]MBK6760879.1 elongation factor G [Ignavibacteria bacterium]MBK7031887.1 elongation factor G [Ignavibacteria bacterium]